MKLFDVAYYDRLQAEFRRSVRTLLLDLCTQLGDEGARLPLHVYRAVADALPDDAWLGFKAVGWAEELNDLCYFRALLRQVQQDGARADAEGVFAECEEQFYENSYLTDLFPSGRPEARGLTTRLRALCNRLERQVTQEAVLLHIPAACSALSPRETLRTPWDLSGSHERGEPANVIPMGTQGGWLTLPRLPAGERVMELRRSGLQLKAGPRVIQVAGSPDGERFPGRWEPPTPVPGFPSFTLGPSIRFGKDKTPSKIVPSPPEVAERVGQALGTISAVWPEGFTNLQRFTSRVVPIMAPGVVSYSYRNRPQLSFINTFHRDQLDLVDDLIHENAHHHLNLLLRKYELRRGDHHREIFYSPWRRSLRSIHGILHASFTFTMGARLFERISSAAGRGTVPGLTRHDVTRARFRCLEEVAAVRYSLKDLYLSADRLRWITARGRELVVLLDREISDVERAIRSQRPAVLRSPFGKQLRTREQELADAREHFRLKDAP
ncbi:MAG: HEXXH motif-containing putative peptide modification protein [Myxococcota bacterium]